MTANDAALWCVVPAAGRSERFGGDIPKQYLPIAGKPLLLHTLERVASHARIAGMMVVVGAHDRHWPRALGEIDGKPVLTTVGGAERADSVLAGLKALPATVHDDHFVLVHDAARPCVALRDISRLIDAGIAAGGALLAAPLRDTLKRADADNRVAATEAREARWRALTPQLFRRGALTQALQASRAQGVAVTDEAMAIERAGGRPLLVEGSADNIKITTPVDLAFAEFILIRQSRGE